MTQPFIPYEKLSKKRQREICRAQRGTWGMINPITKRPCHRARIMRKRRATKLTLMGSKSLVAQEFVRNAQKSCRFEIN